MSPLFVARGSDGVLEAERARLGVLGAVSGQTRVVLGEKTRRASEWRTTLGTAHSLSGADADAAIRHALPEAALAPSAHNTQPARWTVAPDGRVFLLEDCERFLAASDPTRRDHLLSLGAAFEAMSLALSRSGLALTDPLPAAMLPASLLPRTTMGRASTLSAVASAQVVECVEANPLANWVRKRQTYRGTFAPASPEACWELATLLSKRPDVSWVRGEATLQQIATLYDSSLVESLADSAVLGELRGWMRLTEASVRTAIDGLTAPTMQMTPAVASAANWLLRPGPFALLRATGLAKHVVSEAAAVRSANAFVVLHAPSVASRFEAGRSLYRLWLQLTAAGMSACPMSALLDVPGGDARVAHLAGIPAGRHALAVLRVGPSPEMAPARSPRLAPGDLLTPWEAGAA